MFNFTTTDYSIVTFIFVTFHCVFFSPSGAIFTLSEKKKKQFQEFSFFVVCKTTMFEQLNKSNLLCTWNFRIAKSFLLIWYRIVDAWLYYHYIIIWYMINFMSSHWESNCFELTSDHNDTCVLFRFELCAFYFGKREQLGKDVSLHF